MKLLSVRRGAALAAFAAAALLASCGAKPAARYPADTGYPFAAECRVIFADGGAEEFCANVSAPYEGELTFRGGRLDGAVIRVGADGVFIAEDGFEAPLDCPAGAPVRAVVDALCLPASDVTEYSEDEDGVVRVGALCADGVVYVTCDPDGSRTFDFENGCGRYTVVCDAPAPQS